MSRASFVRALRLVGIIVVSALYLQLSHAEELQHLARAFVDGTVPGWRSLGERDFVNVNCRPETWTWRTGLLSCTGLPIGVMRTMQQFTNFEMVAEWRHLRSGGNSGVFVWVSEEALIDLKPGTLPQYGIEVQALDHGFAEQFEK